MKITASTNIAGANNVTGKNAVVIGNLTIGLNADFVRELLAAKDRQINELLNIIARLQIEAKNKPTNKYKVMDKNTITPPRN